MQVQLIHELDHFIEVQRGGKALLRYVYKPDTAPEETPKPYLHPVRTLAGNVVTIFRPHDHLWHKGIAMTWAHLSGQNFWGGKSYVHGQGYVQLPTNGRIEHRVWNTLSNTWPDLVMDESLAWISYGGETWLDEHRVIRVASVSPE